MSDSFITTLLAYKRVIVGALIALIILSGIVFALRINLMPATTSGRDALIREITLGVIAGSGHTTKANPPLQQKQNYATSDRLVLRVVTSPSITQSFTIGARLLDVENPQGNIITLTPAQITIQPGTSTFCCWTVTDPGSYKLQLFRPDGTVTTIPLTVKQDLGDITPLQIK